MHRRPLIRTPRLVVVSNRVPLPRPEGRRNGSGGLVAALRPALESASHSLWFGWSGDLGDSSEPPRRMTSRGVEYATIPLTAEEQRGYYQDFCNRILWPLLHCLPQYAALESSSALAIYRAVNRRFAQALYPLLQEDDLVWVHDYHLIPLGEELRRQGWRGRLGYFHHTPVPTPEHWEAIPDSRALASALAMYDVVGVQTEADAARLRSVVPASAGRIRAYPISIDPNRYRTAADGDDPLEADGRLLFFGVDRLDYTKGIPLRFDAFVRALDIHPGMHRDARYVQWAQPSRSHIPEYQCEHETVLHAAARAMESYPDAIQLDVRAHLPRTVAAALRQADVCLVTSRADGMNLVAKEFAALHSAEDPGTLIITETCGAAEELGDALVIPPDDLDATVEAIRAAYSMPLDERRERAESMREVVDQYTSRQWREAFVRDLRAVPQTTSIRLTQSLGRELSERVEARLRWFEEDETVPRTWARDHSLWQPSPEGVSDRLGWLEVDRLMTHETPALRDFAARAEADGYTTALLLGMGGSAIAPRTFAQVFAGKTRGLRLEVLDSTVPDAIRAVEERIDPERTLVIASSKSGTTVETRCLLDYFWSRWPDPHRFVVITDPGSPLEALAHERGFRQVFLNPPDIGGRYSALSYYGLVPAALLGVDLDRLLGSAARMRDACGAEVGARENPGARLGAALSEAVLMGRDLLAVSRGTEFPGFGAWLEQLIAESTGKGQTGILPVLGATIGESGALSEADAVDVRELRAIVGEPPMQPDPYALGAEYYRWEFAVALAGRVLGINPFDQPDVEASKQATRQLLESGVRETLDAPAPGDILSDVTPDQYVAIHAYVPRSPEIADRLRRLRHRLTEECGVATTLEYGPSLLHSTGQYHKGGLRRGAFIQVVEDEAPEIAIPGRDFDFAALRDAQAEGDRRALEDRGREVSRTTLREAESAF